MDPTWELILKFASILVPVFMTIIMVGVGYIVRQVGAVQKDVTRLMVEDASLRSALQERQVAATRDHALIDRKLDEHDDLLNDHGQRIQKLEYWRAQT